ncbi:MAG: GNAT family N-acetyltransferase [Dokdonella sp.]
MQRTISSPAIQTSTRRLADAANPAAPDGDILRTRNGIELSLRPIQPADAPALVRAFANLTLDQVRMRLFYSLSELPLEMARQLCDVNPERVAAFVVTKPGDSEILAEARVIVDRSAALAEFAIIVDADWTGVGVAHALMTRLIDECRRRGVSEIWGDILADNRSMLDLVQRLGFERNPNASDHSIVRASLAL